MSLARAVDESCERNDEQRIDETRGLRALSARRRTSVVLTVSLAGQTAGTVAVAVKNATVTNGAALGGVVADVDADRRVADALLEAADLGRYVALLA